MQVQLPLVSKGRSNFVVLRELVSQEQDLNNEEPEVYSESCQESYDQDVQCLANVKRMGLDVSDNLLESNLYN